MCTQRWCRTRIPPYITNIYSHIKEFVLFECWENGNEIMSCFCRLIVTIFYFCFLLLFWLIGIWSYELIEFLLVLIWKYSPRSNYILTWKLQVTIIMSRKLRIEWCMRVSRLCVYLVIFPYVNASCTYNNTLLY